MLLSLIETFPIGGIYELRLNAALRRSLVGMRSAALHSIGVRRAHLGPLPAPILDFADAIYRYFTPESWRAADQPTPSEAARPKNSWRTGAPPREV